jgi:hypothetical protein
MVSKEGSRAGDWIAYVGPFRYPWGEPGSRRVHGIAQSLAGAGYDVVVASGEQTPADRIPMAVTEESGRISHVGLGELPHRNASLLSKCVRMYLLWGRRTARWLDRQETKPSHVIVYGGAAQYMFHIRRWGERNRVPILADVGAWSSPRQLSGGALGPAHISAKIALGHD